MTKKEKALPKPAGSYSKETKTGLPPKKPGAAIDVQPKIGREARGFPLVGISASAGGLAAFEAFFSGMPADTEPGIAYVLVQHLAPDHKSILINLIQSDIGRPVGHIVSNLPGYGTLTADIKAVLDTLIPREAEVQTAEGRWYAMRILPYR